MKRTKEYDPTKIRDRKTPALAQSSSLFPGDMGSSPELDDTTGSSPRYTADNSSQIEKLYDDRSQDPDEQQSRQQSQDESLLGMHSHISSSHGSPSQDESLIGMRSHISPSHESPPQGSSSQGSPSQGSPSHGSPSQDSSSGPSTGGPYTGGPYTGGPYTGGPYTGGPIPPLSLRYSTTSDHKLVYLMCYLLGIDKELFTVMSYNMSFLSDLGPKIPKGSEAVLLRSIMGSDKRIYWKNTALLVMWFIKQKDPDIMFFQEMNDREKIPTTDPDFVTLKNGVFEGGYKALLELLSGGSAITYSSNINTTPDGSYYKIGIFKIGDIDYSFLAYSVAKGAKGAQVFPTMLTIWKTARLGEFSMFYGNDLGKSSYYNLTPMEYSWNGPYFHHGRIFSCIRTTNGANLINIHGPNAPNEANTKLRSAIQEYLQASYTAFRNDWKMEATVIGGDTNDAFNQVEDLELTFIDSSIETYEHISPPPKSCCFETLANTLNNYPYSGDKIYVANPMFAIQLYEENQYGIEPAIARGRRKHYRSLKKKKMSKVKQSLYNNKKTVKRSHPKVNKNTVRRPRPQVNKKRRRTYKR